MGVDETANGKRKSDPVALRKMTKDAARRVAARCLLAETVLFALGGTAVYLVSRASNGAGGGVGTGIAVAGAVLLLLDTAGCLVCASIAARGGKGLMGFYLLSKTLKLFVAIAAVTLYGVLFPSGLLPFAVSVFAFYVIGLSSTSVFYAKVEQLLKKK